MNKNNLYVLVEGIDFSGKSSILNRIYFPSVAQIEKYDRLPEGITRPDHNDETILPIDRFNTYININNQFDNIVRKQLESQYIIVRVRGYLSTIAYHNVMIKDLTRNHPHLENRINMDNVLTPNLTFLITVSENDLEERMKERRRKHELHNLESDPEYLLRVQEEFLRLTRDEKLSHLYGNIITVENIQGQLDNTIKTINDAIAEYTIQLQPST